MAQETALRLIIIEESLDDAEKYNRTLRSLGYAVKSTRVEDADGLDDALRSAEYDLVLCSFETPQLPLATVGRTLKEQETPIPLIVVAENPQDTTPEKVLAAGAADLVAKNNPEHLKLVVNRELNTVRRVRQLLSLQTSYLDSEKRCQVLMESSRDAISYVHDGMHVYANMAYLDLFGFEQFEAIEGTPIMDMVAAEEQSKLKDFLRSQAKDPNAKGGKLDVKLKHANNSTFSGEMEFSNATIDGEACTQIVIRDQTSSKELEKQLTALSQKDQLTGLYNRQYLFAALNAACAKSQQDGTGFSLFSMSLDKFDEIKHEVGVLGADQIIKQVGDIIARVSPKGDVLARHEGAHYLLLCSLTQTGHIETLSKAILKNIEKLKTKINGVDVSTTCSIGVSLIDKSVGEANEAFSRTEKALAEVLKTNGNNYGVYVPKVGEKSQKQVDEEWTERFERALQQNHLRLLYQPIVSLSGDKIERFEVSVRMQVDENQEMMESEFMPIAERIGMLAAVDRWVILNTLKKLVVRLKERENTIFFMRLTRGALEDGELFRWIHDRVKALKLPHGSLVFQFSEEDALSHLKQARAFSFALHKINCKIALDNFGTGPNPFQLMKHVPADYLRVNRDFMENLAANPQNQEAIKKIAAKAKELGKPTIAPCVEDAGGLSVLWSLGTDLIQGDFLREPKEDLDYDFSAMMA